MKINFYQSEDTLHKSIASLLIKILENNKRALIYCQNHSIIKQIDDGLWNYSKTKFLPHASILEKCDPSKQPVFITDKEENENQAHFLIKLDQSSDALVKSFEKTFYFFDNHNLAQARKLWVYYKQQTENLEFYKKLDNKWTKVQI